MKKITLCFMLIMSALFIVSCSKDGSDENNSLNLNTTNISVKIGSDTNIDINSSDIKSCIIKVDNAFIADCKISGNNIVVTPKHIGNTFATVSLGNLSKTIKIEVTGTTPNMCGNPIMMFGKSYDILKDSISKLNGIIIQNYTTKMKSICYIESLGNNLTNSYMYFFDNEKLKAINIEIPNYTYLYISQYKQNLSEKYEYIRTDKIDEYLNKSIYKYNDNINVLSYEKLITYNGPHFYNIFINISDDISFLLDYNNFYTNGLPHNIN